MSNTAPTLPKPPVAFASSTDLLHHPYRAPAGFACAQAPVYAASSVFFESVAAARNYAWQEKNSYSYGLHETPNTFVLEERLATLEGGRFCSLYPSGLAAIAGTSLAFLQSGDEVLIPENAYGPNLRLARKALANLGITHQVYDPMSPADLASKLSAASKLVWLEAAGSVSMEFPPLPELLAVCQNYKLIKVLDGTWGAGLAFNAFDFGVDATVHALTKYPSGGGDTLMGSVITRDKALHLKVKAVHLHYGLGVAGTDVSNILKGLGSMELRYRAQDASARQLAVFLQDQPQIAEVLHPALSGVKTDMHSHRNWQTVCGARDLAASLFSVIFQAHYTQAQVDRFCEALRLFKLGYSWGGPLSLAMPYDMPAARTLNRQIWENRGHLVRLAIGLEETKDLQADIQQALTRL